MANKTLTITRVLNAPRKLVFKAWIESEHLARWWGPKGFTSVIHVWAPEPGGGIVLDMVGPDETVYPMSGTFREIDEPNKLVFTSIAIKTEDGTVLLENLNTITFEDDNGKTKLTLHVEVIKSEPGSEMALAGMEQGWSETLDRLASHVAH